AKQLGVRVNGRKRRHNEGSQFDIVKANDRHLCRHRDVSFMKRAQCTNRHMIASNDAGCRLNRPCKHTLHRLIAPLRGPIVDPLNSLEAVTVFISHALISPIALLLNLTQLLRLTQGTNPINTANKRNSLMSQLYKLRSIAIGLMSA